MPAEATVGSPARRGSHARCESISAVNIIGMQRNSISSATGGATPRRGISRYAPVASDLFAVYEKALADGKSDKLAAEEFDDALEQAGL